MLHAAGCTEASDISAIVAQHRHVLMPLSMQARHGTPVITGGDGAYLITSDGSRLLDFSSGWVVTTLGHGHPAVLEAIRRQLDRICWAPPNYVQDTRAAYAAALSQISPWPEGCRIHFTTGGSESNEDAVQIARTLTGRGKVLAAYSSFHGSTAGAAALTGGPRRAATEPYTPGGVVRFWAPFPYHSPFFTDDPQLETQRAIEHLERVLAQENAAEICALIIEPVVGAGGAVVYPEGYLQALRELTRKHGILLIFDEVITGFGRVGDAFAAIRFGVVPDLITFAKASSAAYVPLGGVMVREELARRFDTQRFELGQTHSGHPLAMAAGLGALEAYRELGAFRKAYEIEGWIATALRRLALRHESIGDVRGKGAFFALELVSNRAARTPIVTRDPAGMRILRDFHSEMLREGLMLHGRHNVLLVSPPLTMTSAQFESGIEILDRALTRLEDRLRSTGQTA